MSSEDIVLAFDLYGTLLSTESIAKKLAEHFGDDKAGTLAATWRKYQLEYTWRLNSMEQYEPFSTVTERSLRHTLAESNLSLSAPAMADMMAAYDSLTTFPDVSPALAALADARGISAVVFSNGTDAMLTRSVAQSPGLAPHAAAFAALVSVAPERAYKPAPRVYRALARRVGKTPDAAGMRALWLVSGNPFDVVGARAAGMCAAWVDRAGAGWVDALGDGDVGRPTVIVSALDEVVDAVRAHVAAQ